MSLMRRLSTERFEEVVAELGVQFTVLGDQHYACKRGSTVVEILAAPWKVRDLLVTVRATVLEGATFSEALAKCLLDDSNIPPFGAFVVNAQGDVIFRHSMIGSTLDVKEMKSAFESVAETADAWDDKLVSVAGGRRASESERWKNIAWKDAPSAG